MNILQKIFTNHFEEMKYILHPRLSVLENVEKMIHCGDLSFGGAMFGYSECGELKFVPGFICVLHTFGRDLKWNPHIHSLISEGATGTFTVWRSVKHFNYIQLRNAFQTALL